MAMSSLSLNPFSRSLSSLPSSISTHVAIPQSQGLLSRAQNNTVSTHIQSLMQNVVSGYQQVLQVGIYYPGNILIFKRFLQEVEFEVLKINVGSMKQLDHEQKTHIVAAIQTAYQSIFSITAPQYQQLNGQIVQFYSRMTNDPYAANNSFMACQLMHLAYAKGFLESLSFCALDGLHRMRVDMVTAEHV